MLSEHLSNAVYNVSLKFCNAEATFFRARLVNADTPSQREFAVRLFKRLANAFSNAVRQTFPFRLSNVFSMWGIVGRLRKQFGNV